MCYYDTGNLCASVSYLFYTEQDLDPTFFSADPNPGSRSYKNNAKNEKEISKKYFLIPYYLSKKETFPKKSVLIFCLYRNI